MPSSENKTSRGDYSARHLSVLEGLEAVRKRPGMYIGSTDQRGLMHCVWEIVDNAVDEALEGHGDDISVTVHDDGSIEVRDNGRGVPVDIEPSSGLTGVELVYTKLHAGGKFGGGSYGAAGGLHGVGASVVNALAERMDVEVDRGGKTYAMSFHRGEPGIFDDSAGRGPSSPFTGFTKASELRVIGKVRRGVTGTRVRYWADPQIFPKPTEYDAAALRARLRQTSFLVPGLTLRLEDKRPEAEAIAASTTPAADAGETDDAVHEVTLRAAAKNATENRGDLFDTGDDDGVEVFQALGGTADFVDFLASDGSVTDTFRLTGEGTYTETVQQLDRASGHLRPVEVERTCMVDVALRWGIGYDTTERSFVNIIATPMGGTHLTGFEQALTKVLRKRIEADSRALKLTAKDGRVEKDDIMAGLTAVITVRVPEPQFEGQTKEVLGTGPVRQIVSKVVERELTALLTSSKRDLKTQRAPWRRRSSVRCAPASRRACTKRSLAARPPWRPPPCRPSSPTAAATMSPPLSCSSSRVTPPWGPPRTPATPSSRRSCRSAARSSTCRRPPRPTCCATSSARPSSRWSAPAADAPLTWRPPATARSSS